MHTCRYSGGSHDDDQGRGRRCKETRQGRATSLRPSPKAAPTQTQKLQEDWYLICSPQSPPQCTKGQPPYGGSLVERRSNQCRWCRPSRATQGATSDCEGATTRLATTRTRRHPSWSVSARGLFAPQGSLRRAPPTKGSVPAEKGGPGFQEAWHGLKLAQQLHAGTY